MTIITVLSSLQHSSPAHAIAKSNHLVIASLQIVHVFGFLLLLSSLLLMSLRILGLVLPEQELSAVTAAPSRLFWMGLTLAILTGILMFLTGPAHYYYNRAFELKMLLLLSGALFQWLVFGRIASGDSPRPALTRACVALSLAFWFGIGIAGRAIGFV